MSASGREDDTGGTWRRLLRGRRGVALLILGCWTFVGFFYGTRPYFLALATGRPADFRVVVANFGDAYTWALFTPLILWLAGRFRFQRGSRARALVVHLAASAALGTAGVAANVELAKVIWPAEAQPFGPYFANTFHWNVQWYWMIIGVRYAFEYYRKYRDRELRASQLQTQLARAQLEALRMQMQPHFLFNTLNTISELVHESPEAADRMIVRLGDLLRLSIDNAGTQEVTLRRELEFLQAYLEIERARFRDRLAVRMDVDPALLDARVPNLLLQPLVENALRHGIAERPGPGCVAVAAAAEDGRLRIDVRDDGGGLPAGGAVRERVGLGNTRERLRQLYGADARFELRAAAGGGVVASVVLPLRLAPPESAHEHAFAADAEPVLTPAGESDADPLPGGR